MTEKLNDAELQEVSGGYGESRNGHWMSVGRCDDGYVALRPQPYYDPYHEFAQLYPGYQVFTYGHLTNGSDRNNDPCRYMYVRYNGIWGWAEEKYLH